MKRIIFLPLLITMFGASVSAQRILPQPAQTTVAEGAAPFILTPQTVLKVNDGGLFYNEI